MTNKAEVNGEEVVKDGKVYWMGTEVKACGMCGKVVTAVDDCGEFGNPECPQFGVIGTKRDSSWLRNPYWAVVIFNSGCAQVFALDHEPTNRMVKQFAHLIIPPNDITAVKDRWSLFNITNWSLSTEDDVLKFITDMLTNFKQGQK